MFIVLSLVVHYFARGVPILHTKIALRRKNCEIAG